jgi:hypothetical protein
VARATDAPTVFDPAQGAFSLNEAPAAWMDAGWVENLRRVAVTASGVVSSGVAGAPAETYRGPLEARVELEFREWGKLQMALACGSEQMNVLAAALNAAALPSGAGALPAAAVLAGSTKQELQMGAGAVDFFAVGDLLACDQDYQQQTGYVGTGVAAAYVQSPSAVQHDVDYVRRVTFNVGRVAQKTATSVILGQPLPGGTPLPGAGVQKVVAFLDRDGGGFFQEWSAVFVHEEQAGGRVCLYYPRLRAVGTSGASPETGLPVADGIDAMALTASFVALPVIDVHDGRTVVCFRSYFPAAGAGVY